MGFQKLASRVPCANHGHGRGPAERRVSGDIHECVDWNRRCRFGFGEDFRTTVPPLNRSASVVRQVSGMAWTIVEMTTPRASSLATRLPVRALRQHDVRCPLLGSRCAHREMGSRRVVYETAVWSQRCINLGRTRRENGCPRQMNRFFSIVRSWLRDHPMSVLGVLVASPVVFLAYPPMSDFPAHEAIVAVLRHRREAAYIPIFTRTIGGHPNRLFYILQPASPMSWTLRRRARSSRPHPLPAFLLCRASHSLSWKSACCGGIGRPRGAGLVFFLGIFDDASRHCRFACDASDVRSIFETADESAALGRDRRRPSALRDPRGRDVPIHRHPGCLYAAALRHLG